MQLAACAMITPVSFAMLRMMSIYGKWQERLKNRLERPAEVLDAVGAVDAETPSEVQSEDRLESDVMTTLSDSDRYALFLMAFTATLREGVEAVVFIVGVSQGNPTSIPIPGCLGLILGALFSWFVFFGAKPINITPFMYCTALVMFAIGAGLLSRAMHAFQMAGYFGSMGNRLGPDYADYSYSAVEYSPALVPEQPAWVNVALGHFRGCCAANGSNTSFFSVLRAIFGYSDRPTRLEIIAYVGYWGYVLASLALKWRAGTLYGKFAAPAVEHGCDEETARMAGVEVGASALPPAEDELREAGAADQEGSGRAAQLLARIRAVPRRTRVLAAILTASTVFALCLGLLLPKPPAGRPVAHFTLVIARSANASLPCAPGKPQITVNGVWPAPTLRVPFGSAIKVTIVNELVGESTAIHWHGMQQRGTPWQDGVVGVTQCPIPPVAGANSLTVDFTPDWPGTFWYHGHMGGQIVDGLYGALIVDDGGAFVATAGSPAFVADDWVWLISDWYNQPVCHPTCGAMGAMNATLMDWYMSKESKGVEPVPDALVVNDKLSGQMVLSVRRDAPQRVRIVNAAALNMFNVSVDGMPLIVVELDGVAVAPLKLPWLVLNVAQRASVVLDWSLMHPSLASQPAVRFRVSAMAMYAVPSFPTPLMAPYIGVVNSTTSTLLGTPAAFDPAWTGTIAFTAVGATVAYTDSDVPFQAASPPTEMNLLPARSFPAQPAPNATQFLSLAFGFANDPVTGVNLGYVNNASYALSPAALAVPLLRSFTSAQPLTMPAQLSGVLRGDGLNPFLLPHARVVQVLISNVDTGEHPFHLHGHNFWIVSTSAFPEAESLFAPHYVRRDVVSVPPNGWAKIRFVADNPGVWLLHCHIEVGACVRALTEPFSLSFLCSGI